MSFIDQVLGCIQRLVHLLLQFGGLCAECMGVSAHGAFHQEIDCDFCVW
jgi:hypothetical protein